MMECTDAAVCRKIEGFRDEKCKQYMAIEHKWKT